MAGFFGKVLATATGIAVYELGVRPLIADRFGARAAAQELSEDELDSELEESDAQLAQLEAEIRAEEREKNARGQSDFEFDDF